MSVVDWIYPIKCVGCGRGGRYWCDSCLSKVERVDEVCPVCERRSIGGWRHSNCRRGQVERLVASYRYKGLVRKTLKQVKYRRSWQMIDEVAEIWVKNVKNKIFDEVSDIDGVIVSCVPMYLYKQKSRGFNQAERLAKKLAEGLEIEYRGLLIRKRKTKPMYGLSKQERKENIKNVFEVIDGTLEDIELVILVDDVWTTGSTIQECAKVLHLAGVDEVWGVVVGR